MKKLFIVLSLLFAVAITTTSCKKEKKVIKAETTVLYQCPMDCEKGKSYTEAGSCPVCKMDLKAKKPGNTKEVKKVETHKHEGNDHGHEH